MLTITVYPKNHKLTFEGHAEFDKKGEDLVCAAASGFFYQLAQTLKNYEGIAFFKKPRIDIGKDRSEIQCKPYSQYAPTIDVIYQTVLNGFVMLEESFPDNIHVEISS